MYRKPKKEKPLNTLKSELRVADTILSELGFSLDEYQPHISGERSLMGAITTKSGKKLILLGKRKSDAKRVVIKISADTEGKQEIQQERIAREALKNIIFSYKVFFSPEEILFKKVGKYSISIQEYINQKCTFLERPLEEQFSLALRAFKAQESAHSVTYGHKKATGRTFAYVNSSWYIESYEKFKENICRKLPENKKLHLLLQKGFEILTQSKERIEQYCNFLTHTDFVPHNFRVIENNIYLLDHSSLRFGNKYECWARFLNFMTLHNRPLEEACLFYIKNNRTKEEYQSLQLMRIYRLGEIIWYYTNLLEKTSGDLHTLTNLRIDFWTSVLEATLKKERVDEKIVNEYKNKRDSLRSDEEKERQKIIH